MLKSTDQFNNVFFKLGVTSLLSSIIFMNIGCGAEIKPDGPQRVVYTKQDGSKRVIVTRESDELRKIAIDKLILMTTDQSPEVRANALEAISSVPGQAEPVVAISLTDSNEGVRTVAAMVAAQEMMTPLSPSIRLMLDDESPFVRSSAMYALKLFEDEIDISELATMLLESPNPRVRSHVAFILGELGDSSAIPLLETASRAAMPQALPIEKKIFRLQIAEALIKLGHAESIDTVRAALYPSQASELEATALAVQIIGEINDEASIDQLIYLADPNADLPMPAEVRLGVASTLAKLGHREGSFVADEYFDNDLERIRAQSATVYGCTIGRGNLGKLESMMFNDVSTIARVAAAGAIIELTTPESASAN